ncbi:hypothetical protein [Actinocrinis puniceicyclus]|nr:hypothetical protein [Actinocrinis puniceicyclus]
MSSRCGLAASAAAPGSMPMRMPMAAVLIIAQRRVVAGVTGGPVK